MGGLAWIRRGLATNLYRLGVSDKTIQAILRHANVSTTMDLYVKAVGSVAVAAMQALAGFYATIRQRIRL